MDTNHENSNSFGDRELPVLGDTTGIDIPQDNQSDITNKTKGKPWLFQKGNPGGPGRPKGKSLKEYSREMLASMTEEERLDFLEGLPKETIWKMAEGNPHQSNDTELGGEITLKISKEIADKYETTLIPGDNSEGQA